MLKRLEQFFDHQFKSLILRGYGWKPEQRRRQGRMAVQWQDPLSLLWYSEDMAVKLVKIQAIDEYDRR